MSERERRGQDGTPGPAVGLRLSRRQFIRRAGLLGAGLAALPALVACGGGDAPAPASGGGGATTATT
ncbi:MAG: hypothetical protein M3Q65_24485, partial [Chloroflexota bacterium]|nr:hypothetical protein [Chloroflexota bacterium]